MGKPTATDLQLGLATAPVLFACEQVWNDLDLLLNALHSRPYFSAQQSMLFASPGFYSAIPIPTVCRFPHLYRIKLKWKNCFLWRNAADAYRLIINSKRDSRCEIKTPTVLNKATLVWYSWPFLACALQEPFLCRNQRFPWGRWL